MGLGGTGGWESLQSFLLLLPVMHPKDGVGQRFSSEGASFMTKSKKTKKNTTAEPSLRRLSSRAAQVTPFATSISESPRQL
eukprot:5607475-Amphidinium_carterae.1